MRAPALPEGSGPAFCSMGWGGCGKDWGGNWGGGGQDWGKGGGQDWGKGGQDWGKGGQDWGKGGGYGGGGCGKGYGGGKGFGGAGSNWGGYGVWQPMFNPMMMMKGMGKAQGLRGFANDKKVWIGGLPADSCSKELNIKLKDHMSTAGVSCLYADVGKTGQGGAAFKTNSDAMTAAAALNGSAFEGGSLQVDMWGKKPACGGSNWGGCGVWQPMFNPMMMMKGMGKGSNGLRDFKNDRKVWIGGLPPGTNSRELNKKLKDHLSTAGVPCVYAEIHRTGSGGAAFKSESEAQTAAAALNGSVFEGVMLQVEMWGKKTA
ncbi:unnamed protein product [Effrenium voratum]|nr:unnamed protein product [Effrenium voratum]